MFVYVYVDAVISLLLNQIVVTLQHLASVQLNHAFLKNEEIRSAERCGAGMGQRAA